MKTGKAYGYFAYEGEAPQLIENMDNARKRFNFSETLGFTVLEDKVSGLCHPNRAKLPVKIDELAKSTKVYGTAPSKCSPKVSRELSRIKPVKASKLRYLIMAELPEASDMSHGYGGYGQYGANSTTAGQLGAILNTVGMESASGISRNSVFYLDGRGKAQEAY